MLGVATHDLLFLFGHVEREVWAGGLEPEHKGRHFRKPRFRGQPRYACVTWMSGLALGISCPMYRDVSSGPDVPLWL